MNVGGFPLFAAGWRLSAGQELPAAKRPVGFYEACICRRYTCCRGGIVEKDESVRALSLRQLSAIRTARRFPRLILKRGLSDGKKIFDSWGKFGPGARVLKTQEFQPDDEAVLQYRRPQEALTEFAEAHGFQLEKSDFQDLTSTEAFAARLKEQKFVPTHILHVPAAPIENKRFAEYTWDEVERQMNVQVRSLWLVLQAVIKPMAKAKQGKIILILTSCTKCVPPKFLAAYLAGKFALMGLGKALASEYAPKHIQVNMISPSMMETKFLQNVYDGVVEQSAAANPMGRNATVQDVVPLVRFLFADDNSFITGANIPVTGGEVF